MIAKAAHYLPLAFLGWMMRKVMEPWSGEVTECPE